MTRKSSLCVGYGKLTRSNPPKMVISVSGGRLGRRISFGRNCPHFLVMVLFNVIGTGTCRIQDDKSGAAVGIVLFGLLIYDMWPKAITWQLALIGIWGWAD